LDFGFRQRVAAFEMAVAAVLADQVDNGVHGAFREIKSNRHDGSIKTLGSSKSLFRLPEK
jgi:hypothetical protein